MITSAQLAEWKAQDLADMAAAGYNPELIDCEELTDEDLAWIAYQDVTPEQEAREAFNDRLDMYRNEY